MVRTRKAIYVGIQEVKRRYIGNKLIFENLGDMEDRDKVSDTEIFTDKADDSVVHVGVDGKSYQDGVPTPDYPIEIHSLNDFDVVSSVEKLTEGQLEEYDYDTEYENIYKINLSLSEPLRSVGDVKDRLFRDSDGLWKVERNVGEATFNGSEPGWTSYDINTNNIQYWSNSYPNNVKPESSSNKFSKSTHFETITSSERNLVSKDNSAWFGGNAQSVHFVFNKTNPIATTLSTFRSWLSQNPVTTQYELSSKTVESLPQDTQEKLNNLRSFQGSNYVCTVINNILPTVAENLKPTLHATFKSKGWYDNYQNTLLK